MKVREAIRRMEVYNPPLEERVKQDYLLLDFSESTAPPDEAVLEAMRNYVSSGRMRMYPSYGGFLESLADYAKTSPDQVIITNGSDSAIQIITHALLEPGDEMVMARPGFAVTENCALSSGAKVVSPLYRKPDMAFPLEEIQQAVTDKTRLIVVTNPNNPSGTSAGQDQIEAILRAHPDVALMVDEAYYEFSGFTAVPLLKRYDNLVIIRTFSKAFALAGLRLGYALSNPRFIGELYKIRIPYDVNALAVVAAQVQLERPESWRVYVEEVMIRAKPMVERFFAEHGVFFYPSAANFLLVRPEDVGRSVSHLREHGILVRPQRAPVDDCFRVSIGTVADMRHFMEIYAQLPGLDGAGNGGG